MSALDRFPFLVKNPSELNAQEQLALARVAPLDRFKIIVTFPPFDEKMAGQSRAIQTRSLREGAVRQVWAVYADELYIFQRQPNQKPSLEQVPLSQVRVIEQGEILLHSWLELTYGRGADTRSIYVDFNTVGLDWIGGLLDELRGGPLATTAGRAPAEAARLEQQMARLPFKWQAILRGRVLHRDESVTALAFEPSRRPRVMRWGGREGKLLLLTNRRVLDLREPLEAYPYGKILRSCLRSTVQTCELTTEPKQTTIHIAIETGATWESTFPASEAYALQVIAAELQSARSPVV